MGRLRAWLPVIADATGLLLIGFGIWRLEVGATGWWAMWLGAAFVLAGLRFSS